MAYLNEIGIVGSGNVAFHLIKAIQDSSTLHLKGLYTRNKKVGNELQEQFSVTFYTDLNELACNSKLIIIAVADDAIETIAQQINATNQHLIVHTSGSVPISVLKKSALFYGSFYPLQTFTKEREADFNQIPILIHANDENKKEVLIQIANELSSIVREINDEERKKLHLAAVMVNNFTNHIYTLANSFTDKSIVDFELLKPLIQETALKIKTVRPDECQTGPAKRNDQGTIQEHLAMLTNEELKELYLWFTDSIRKYYE